VSRSSERTTLMSTTEAHPWLKGRVYDPRRQRTVELVQNAVDNLVMRGLRVSLASVIAESRAIDPEGRGVSRNGILGNAEARSIYDHHKSWKGSPRPNPDANASQRGASVQRPIDPHRDTARVRNRLVRKGKAELADRVLELEQGFAVQEERWLALNDELLQWRLRAEKAAGQVEKMRRALDAKDAQVRELQKRLDDLLMAGSVLTDAAAHHALQDALKRVQKAEEQAKDLRVRLFAKKVVRMRDKARRLSKKATVTLTNPTQ
jgi:hypothetical protein